MAEKPSNDDPPPLPEEASADVRVQPAGCNCDSDRGAEPSTRRLQFALSDLLLTIAVVAIGLIGLHWVDAKILMGIWTIAATAMFIAQLIWKPRSRLFWLVWYALLIVLALVFIVMVATTENISD